MNPLALFSACVIFLSLLSGCSREKSAAPVPPAGKDATAVSTVLATIGEDERPPTTAVPAMHAPLNQEAVFQLFFSDAGGGAAYIAEKAGTQYVVHNGKAGKQYATVGKVALSPDGLRIAYGAIVGGKWRIIADGREGRSFDAVRTPVFSPDSRHIAYQAMKGEKWFIVVDGKLNAGTTGNYSGLAFNADSTLIAYAQTADDRNKGGVIISDLAFRGQSVVSSAGDQLVINKHKTRLAAIRFLENKQQVIDFSFKDTGAVHGGGLYESIGNLTFSDDGLSVSYFAVQSGGKRLLVLDDREEPLPDENMTELPVIRPDRKGVGVILNSPNRYYLHQAFMNAGEKKKIYDEAAYLTYSSDSRHYAYAARKGGSWFVVVDGAEGPAFDRVVSPVFSPDGKKVVYRARKNGKRFVVVAGVSGKTIKQHPAFEQVFQPVFTSDGKSLAYGVKDGNRLIWEVERL